MLLHLEVANTDYNVLRKSKAVFSALGVPPPPPPRNRIRATSLRMPSVTLHITTQITAVNSIIITMDYYWILCESLRGEAQWVGEYIICPLLEVQVYMNCAISLTNLARSFITHI